MTGPGPDAEYEDDYTETREMPAVSALTSEIPVQPPSPFVPREEPEISGNSSTGYFPNTFQATINTNPPKRLSSMEIPDEAKALIHGERAQAYGSAEESFAMIGEFWTSYLKGRLAPGQQIDAYDVSMMMTLMKVSRARTDVSRDTAVDICGYAALSERCAVHAGRLKTD